MRSLFDPVDRERMLDRFRSLNPDAPARWGRMNAITCDSSGREGAGEPAR